MHRITPYLIYDDVDAALEFMTMAFGFQRAEPRAVPGHQRHTHRELELDDGSRVRINRPPADDEGPRAGARRVMLQVGVDDIEAHHDRAAAAGATIVRDIEVHHGDRTYTATDPEGHVWEFVQYSTTT